METQVKQKSGIPVFLKALALVLISSATVAIVMSIQSSNMLEHRAIEVLHDHSALTVSGISDNSGGALRFGKPEKVDEQFAMAMDKNPDILTNLQAYNGDGALVTANGDISASDQAIVDQIVTKAIETGQAQRDPSGFILAIPVKMGAAARWSARFQASGAPRSNSH